MKPYLKPIFFDNFSCVAGACRNTCCAGWNISVDEVTAGKYKKNNIKLDGKQMPLREDGRCSCLRDDGLCALVCKYGENMLSYTCDFFPRTALENDNYIELYLDNACQAVLEFLMTDNSENRHLTFTDCDTYERNISCKKLLDRRLFTIRDFVIDLLQVEASSVWTRSFAAYRFIKNNAEMGIDEVETNISKYYDENYLAKVLVDIDVLNLDLSPAIQYKAHMFGNINGNLDKGYIYNKYIVPIMERLGNADIEELVNGWKGFKSVMEPYDYFFENYIVNSVYRSLLPTSKEETLSDNSEVLLVQLAMSYFTCYMWWFLNERKINDEEIIDIGGHYARIVEHNKTHCSKYLNKLKKDGDLTLGIFYMLLAV